MRFLLAAWLSLSLLLPGCIMIDRPILDRDKSVAPKNLVGLWEGLFLFEQADPHALRVTVLHEDRSRIIYRATVHAAALSAGFYVLEAPAGAIHLVRLKDDGPSFADLAPGVTAQQIETIVRRHKIELSLKGKPPNLQIEKISGAPTHKRLVALLNELIDSELLVSGDVPLTRTTDPALLENVRQAAAQHDAARNSMFASALSRMGNPSTRSEACSDMSSLFSGGDIEAGAQAGRCRLYGWGYEGKPDQGKAFEVLRVADAFGSGIAKYEIGKTYAEESGGEDLDGVLARFKLEEAASLGNPDAKALLAKINDPSYRPAPKEKEEEITPECVFGSCELWIYENEKKADKIVARIASAKSMSGRSTLRVRSDDQGRVAVFFHTRDSAAKRCEKQCALAAAFGEEEVRRYAVVRAGATSDGIWLGVVEAGDFYRQLLANEQVVAVPMIPGGGMREKPDGYLFEEILDNALLSIKR